MDEQGPPGSSRGTPLRRRNGRVHIYPDDLDVFGYICERYSWWDVPEEVRNLVFT
jgi:hypothetical protein